MQAKKSVISYGFFIVFSALAGYCLWIMVNQLTTETAFFQVPGLPAAYRFVFPILITAVGMLFMILIFSVFRAFVHIRQAAPKWVKILFPILVMFCAVAALTVYILHHIPIVINDGTYYYAAEVTSDRASLAFEPHGLSFVYLYLLRSLFLIFGNDPFVGIVFQLVLYFSILLIAYIAVNTISGFGPALLTMAALAVYPGTFAEIFRLTPHVFGLFVHVLGIAVVGMLISFYKKNEIDGFFRAAPWIFAGIYIAFAVYLDLLNLVLLFWGLSLLFDTDPERKKSEAVFCILQELIGFLLGLLAVAGLLYVSGIDVIAYVLQLFTMYFGTPELAFGIAGFESVRYTILALILLTGCIWTACGFVVQKFDRMSHYFFSLIVIAASAVFSCYVLDPQQLMKFYLILLCAMGVSALVYREPEISEEEEKPENEEKIVRDIEEIEAEAEAEAKAEAEIKEEPAAEMRADNEAGNDSHFESVAVSESDTSSESQKAEDVAFRIVGTDTEGYDFEEEETSPSEKETAVVPAAVEEAVVRPGSPLANPLPLPKKKPRKPIQFGKEIPEEMMYFDIEVDENDDYDFD